MYKTTHIWPTYFRYIDYTKIFCGVPVKIFKKRTAPNLLNSEKLDTKKLGHNNLVPNFFSTFSPNPP